MFRVAILKTCEFKHEFVLGRKVSAFG